MVGMVLRSEHSILAQLSKGATVPFTCRGGVAGVYHSPTVSFQSSSPLPVPSCIVRIRHTIFAVTWTPLAGFQTTMRIHIWRKPTMRTQPAARCQQNQGVDC